MKKITQLYLILSLLYSTPSSAQETFYYDDEKEKEYAITKDLPEEIRNKYLEENELKALEFNTDTTSEYTFRVQLKNGDWELFNSYNVEFIGDYSMNFPNSIFGYGAPITITKHKNKTFFFSFLQQRVLEDLWFVRSD